MRAKQATNSEKGSTSKSIESYAFRFDCGRGRLMRSVAFTLAEVLITLGIIGIIAAITTPTIMANVQKAILKPQFKSAYSKFYQAVLQTQASMGSPVECFYWITGDKHSPVCDTWNDYGTCTHWSTTDYYNDTSGLFGECPAFEEELFTNTLKVVKFCQDQALKNGCLTNAHRGIDKIKQEQNPDISIDPNDYYNDNAMKNNYSSWILADGMMIIKMGTYKKNRPNYAIDINGHKGPNKWGYDIFSLHLLGDYNGTKTLTGDTYAVDKGGTYSSRMVINAFSK